MQRVRHHSDANRTRVVLDLDREFSYAVRQVDSPERIVIELTGATIVSPSTIRYDGSPVDRIRFNRLNGRAQIVNVNQSILLDKSRRIRRLWIQV